MPDVMDEFLNRENYDSSEIWAYDLALSRRFWITLFALSFIVPVIRLKKMDALRITSGVALGCFAYVVLIVLLYAFIPELDACSDVATSGECRGSVQAGPSDALSFMKVVPIYIFGCVKNSFLHTLL